MPRATNAGSGKPLHSIGLGRKSATYPAILLRRRSSRWDLVTFSHSSGAEKPVCVWKRPPINPRETAGPSRLRRDGAAPETPHEASLHWGGGDRGCGEGIPRRGKEAGKDAGAPSGDCSRLDPLKLRPRNHRPERLAVDDLLEADAVGIVLLFAEAEEAGAEGHERIASG